MDIKFIDSMIKHEIHDIEDYLSMASKCKSEREDSISNQLLNIATQRVGHLELLLRMLDDKIADWESKNRDTEARPNIYKDIWYSYHDEAVRDYEDLKNRIERMR